jgi:putative FmdB family regulatory protein
MPIYEYQCAACGHQLEVIQKMSDKPLTDCPKCHQPALNKLVSAAGFQLKGTGWYKTDYSAKGKPKSGEETGSGTDTNSGGTETKSADTKASADTKTSADAKTSTDTKSKNTSSDNPSTSGTSTTKTGAA